MLLQHLESLAKTASGYMLSDTGENNRNIVEEYSKELNADIQSVKAAAASFNQDPSAVINRYQTEYEMYLTSWLNAISRCENTVKADVSGDDHASSDLQRRKRQIENKFKRFREWRNKAIQGAQRKFLPRNTPVTELESAKANLQEREARQRLMKKANTIIRNKKDVTPQLIQLLGAGSEEEAARLQQADPEGNAVGYTPHELSNNNANIFRLKRRVKDLERKIGMMQCSNEEAKEMNGIRMVYNYTVDRIQLFFAEKPVAMRLCQLKGNGWHWSPSAGCWQRKITESAKKSAERIYKGEYIEIEGKEKIKIVPEKKEKKEKVKKEKKSEVRKINETPLAEVPKEGKKVEIAPQVKVEVKVEREEAPVPEKMESKPEPKKTAKAKAEAKAEAKKELKMAAKRELKREILVKATPAAKTEVKTEEKPKAIDWAKIAAQVERRAGAGSGNGSALK